MSDKPKISPPISLATPSHGHGKLKRGNTVGVGRPKEELRVRMREALATRLHIASDIADDPEAAPETRLKALEFLSRYGLGTSDEKEITKRETPQALSFRKGA